MRIGIEPQLKPVTFIGTDGRPRGFAIDVLNAAAAAESIDVTYIAKPYPELMEEFAAGRIDAIANLVKTSRRAPYMAFSVPYLHVRDVLVVRNDAPAIKSVDDLRRIRVATTVRHIDDAPNEMDGAGGLVMVASLEDALKAVSEGRSDAAISTRITATTTLGTHRYANLKDAPLDLPSLHGHDLRVAFHPEDAQSLAALNDGLHRIHENGTYDALYERWIDQLEPRSLRWAELDRYVTPALLAVGTLLILVAWQRRTVRLLATQANELRRSEQRLTLVLEGGEHGLWEWDFATGRVERNRRTTALLGYSDSELPETSAALQEIIHPEDRTTFTAAVDSVRSPRADSFSVQYRIRTHRGEWRWIATRGKVMERNADGQPLRAAGTHTDVTTHKHLEEERVAFQQKVLEAQKLESLGLLAGGMAHDFNNLLTVILGQATLVRMAGTPTPYTENALQQIESASRRAADLCRQMLVYAGGGSFSMQRVDLNALLTGLAPLLRHSVRKDARLEFELAGDLPSVEADPTQLRQIVMNLVINASEALPSGGGIITVITSCASPTEAELRDAVYKSDLPAGPCARLTVKDTGCGMTPAVRAKIFEPFFTTKFTGRGLGLAAVLGIVRAHHGTFAVQSAPNVGSAFTLFLAGTMSASTASASADGRTSFAPQASTTILIADDEPAVLAMASAVLKHHGYDVIAATHGREAIAHFAAAPDRIGAVVLDFTMPELNGVGALTEIRCIRPGIPAVIMSGFGSADALARLPADNPPVFLQKPFAQDELLLRVGEAIATRSRGRSPAT